MNAHHVRNLLDPNAFRRYNYTTADPVQYLYHVYDNLSQTPYVPKIGINAGDVNSYIMHPQHIITYAAMANHLNWNNREPTYFISGEGIKSTFRGKVDNGIQCP